MKKQSKTNTQQQSKIFLCNFLRYEYAPQMQHLSSVRGTATSEAKLKDLVSEFREELERESDAKKR